MVTIKLSKLQEAPAKKYKLSEGIMLEKCQNDDIILSNEAMTYRTIKLYDSANPNVLGTVEIQNNPEYSIRVNLRENSDTAYDPARNNSAVLFKKPVVKDNKKKFQGPYIIRPSMASYIRANIANWKENLRTKIEPAVLNELEEQAREHLEQNKLSEATFEYELSKDKKVRLTFKVERSEDIQSTVEDIQTKRLNKTQDLTDKQKALVNKYNQMVEAEQKGKIVAMCISLEDRDLRHTFWNANNELGEVEHIEMQKAFTKIANKEKKEVNETSDVEIVEDASDILA